MASQWRVVNVKRGKDPKFNGGWKMDDRNNPPWASFDQSIRRWNKDLILVDTPRFFVRWWDDSRDLLQIFYLEET